MPIESIGTLLALDDAAEEKLAHQAPKLDVSDEELLRIARVALRISQLEAERTAKVLPPGTVFKPWKERTARQRVEDVATVTRVIQSMILLGWLEPPGN